MLIFNWHFTWNFAQKVAPLIALTHKGVSFKWTYKVRGAFDDLKQAFTMVPVLSHLDTSHPFLMEADASVHAVRTVLSQWHSLNGQLHLYAYFSCQSTAAERNYNAWDGERLALMEACAEWRHLLVGPVEPHLVLTYH